MLSTSFIQTILSTCVGHTLSSQASAANKIWPLLKSPHVVGNQTRPLHLTLSSVVAAVRACAQKATAHLAGTQQVLSTHLETVDDGLWTTESELFSRKGPVPPLWLFSALIRSANHPTQPFPSLVKSFIQSFTTLLLVTEHI